MKAKWLSGAVLAASLGTTQVAHAGVIFSTFGTGQSYNTGLAVTVNYQESLATPFTPGANATIGDVTVAFVGTSPVTLSLVSDSSGIPGSTTTALWSSSFNPNTGASKVFDFTGMAVNVTAGIRYWLVAESSGTSISEGWAQANASFATPIYDYSVPGSGTWTPDSTVLAFSVATDPVPEPASLLLLGSAALLTLAAARPRRTV